MNQIKTESIVAISLMEKLKCYAQILKLKINKSDNYENNLLDLLNIYKEDQIIIYYELYNFNKKDTKKYLDKLLVESIKNSNIVIFDWCYNKLILYEEFI